MSDIFTKRLFKGLELSLFARAPDALKSFFTDVIQREVAVMNRADGAFVAAFTSNEKKRLSAALSALAHHYPDKQILELTAPEIQTFLDGNRQHLGVLHVLFEIMKLENIVPENLVPQPTFGKDGKKKILDLPEFVTRSGDAVVASLSRYFSARDENWNRDAASIQINELHTLRSYSLWAEQQGIADFLASSAQNFQAYLATFANPRTRGNKRVELRLLLDHMVADAVPGAVSHIAREAPGPARLVQLPDVFCVTDAPLTQATKAILTARHAGWDDPDNMQRHDLVIALRALSEWCKTYGRDIAKLTQEDAEFYLAEYPNTRTRKNHGYPLNDYFNALQTAGIVKHNPFAFCKTYSDDFDVRASFILTFAQQSDARFAQKESLTEQCMRKAMAGLHAAKDIEAIDMFGFWLQTMAQGQSSPYSDSFVLLDSATMLRHRHCDEFEQVMAASFPPETAAKYSSVVRRFLHDAVGFAEESGSSLFMFLKREELLKPESAQTPRYKITECVKFDELYRFYKKWGGVVAKTRRKPEVRAVASVAQQAKPSVQAMPLRASNDAGSAQQAMRENLAVFINYIAKCKIIPAEIRTGFALQQKHFPYGRGSLVERYWRNAEKFGLVKMDAGTFRFTELFAENVDSWKMWAKRMEHHPALPLPEFLSRAHMGGAYMLAATRQRHDV